jgi:hypothetical protein
MKHRISCFRLLLTLSAICIAGTHLHAAPILGSQVTGELVFGVDARNWFDKANGNVPSGFLNSSGATTVAISGSAVEFSHRDGINAATAQNWNTADFTGNQLIITDIIQGRSKNLQMIFTDEAFVGATLTELSDSFPNGGVTAILDGSTIKLTWAGTSVTTFTTFKAVFDLAPGSAQPNVPPPANAVAHAPEPASIVLVGSALLGAIVFSRRRVYANN